MNTKSILDNYELKAVLEGITPSIYRQMIKDES